MIEPTQKERMCEGSSLDDPVWYTVTTWVILALVVVAAPVVFFLIAFLAKG